MPPNPTVTTVTVLGCQGAYPSVGQPCSAYLVESSGFRLVVDLGYATIEPLLRLVDATDIDAVLVTHGHPDHCADLSPLIRARRMAEHPSAPLPLFAPAGALDVVLSLDNVKRTAEAVDLTTVGDGDAFRVGPFEVTAVGLPHFVPNLGFRLSLGGGVGGTFAYTGDCGPDPAVVELGRDADLFVIESTHLEPITGDHRGLLTDVRSAVEQAVAANACETLLTHLWPGTDPLAAEAIASSITDRPVRAARPGHRLGPTSGSGLPPREFGFVELVVPESFFENLPPEEGTWS